MLKNHRILVIDDNESIHFDFRKVLGSDGTRADTMGRAAASLFNEDVGPAPIAGGYDIDSAYQGQQGWERVQLAWASGAPYAIVFVDVRMPPGWDGIETTKRIWEIDADVQVVLCTAHSDYSWHDIAMKLGKTDRLLVLKKPFDNIEVRQIACAMTTKWQLARQVRGYLTALSTTVAERTTELAESHRLLRVEVDERRKAAEILRETEGAHPCNSRNGRRRYHYH